MAETIILTGWGWRDYAGAAAAALRRWKYADASGMSQRRLPEFLHKLSLKPGKTQRVIILGIGLERNPELLLESLSQLHTAGVETHWISIESFPKSLPPKIQDCLNICEINAETLTEAVGSLYESDYSDILNFLNQKTGRAEKKYTWPLLIDAAMYFYRNYQDEKPYRKVIERLADGNDMINLATSEKKLIDHFLLYGTRELTGRSEMICKLQHKINLIAAKDHARVIIYGETGTGKETVATQIHNKSSRRDEAFIPFNCASVSAELLESRFFGHEKGSFTGATEQKYGIFERANGGTVFLDEIGELNPEVQGILLRFLETGRFFRVGEKEEVESEVRLITATHRNLAQMVREGKFREDLFHRLNIIPVWTPSLREHPEDIPLIADSYWLRRHLRRLTSEQKKILKDYDWPGNVRELFNFLERASVLEEMDFTDLMKEHRELVAETRKSNSNEYPDNLQKMKQLHIRRVLAKHDGNITHAAEALGITRVTLKKILG